MNLVSLLFSTSVDADAWRKRKSRVKRIHTDSTFPNQSRNAKKSHFCARWAIMHSTMSADVAANIFWTLKNVFMVSRYDWSCRQMECHHTDIRNEQCFYFFFSSSLTHPMRAHVIDRQCGRSGVCLDYHLDSCEPSCNENCEKACYAETTQACGGGTDSATLCPKGMVCIDDETDDCTQVCWTQSLPLEYASDVIEPPATIMPPLADCPRICAAPIPN